MSKDKADLSKDIKGEFVGINNSIDLYAAMMNTSIYPKIKIVLLMKRMLWYIVQILLI